MEQISLTAQPRNEIGKGHAGRMRAAGSVPAILYGPSIKGAVALKLNGKELGKVLHTAAGGNVLVSLLIEGDKKARMAMFKELTRHPLKGSIEHVDLMEILMDHKIVVEVPLHVMGKAVGIAYGGIVTQELRRLKVECLPTQIPDSIDVDVTPLNVGFSIHVKDLILAEGLKAVGDQDATIVSVVAPTEEVAPKTAEEVEAELAKSFEEKEEGGKKEEEK